MGQQIQKWTPQIKQQKTGQTTPQEQHTTGKEIWQVL